MEGWPEKVEKMEAKIVALLHSAVALREDFETDVAREDQRRRNLQEASILLSDEAAWPSQPPQALLQQSQQATSPKAASVMHPSGGSRELNKSIFDAILKNQEALQMILIKQDTLKSLVERLQKTVSNIDERIQMIEQQMDLLAQFTQELNQVKNESSWD